MQYARHRRIVSELGREPVKRFRRIGVCALDLDGDDVVAKLKIRLRQGSTSANGDRLKARDRHSDPSRDRRH